MLSIELLKYSDEYKKSEYFLAGVRVLKIEEFRDRLLKAEFLGTSPKKYLCLVREGSGTIPGVINDTLSSENFGVEIPDFNCY